MSKSFSRRRFLRTTLAASVLPILPDAARGAPPAPKRLVAGTRMLEVNGHDDGVQISGDRPLTTRSVSIRSKVFANCSM